MGYKEFQFVHACRMLWKNRRNYTMLSVTIVLSFTVLLLYLCITDSSTYNKYKEIFGAPREVVMAYAYGDRETEVQTMMQMAKEADPGVSSYQFFEANTHLRQYGDVLAKLTFLPFGERPVFRDICGEQTNYAQEVSLIRGDSFVLQNNEAIITERFFQQISPEGQLPFQLNIPFVWEDGTHTVFSVNVVGVCEDSYETSPGLRTDEYGEIEGSVQIYLSQTLLGSRTVQDIPNPRRVIFFYSQFPQQIVGCAKQFDFTLHAVCQAQDVALQSIATQKATKAVIAIALLLLLGINLYSSFSNALSERKFEIGVKRAIGASAWAIIRQFLTEGIVVMVTNIIASIALSSCFLAAYKLYKLLVQGEQWIISLSSYSVWMFLTCSVSLGIVFSLVFAYQSTNVEIVKHLKAE